METLKSTEDGCRLPARLFEGSHGYEHWEKQYRLNTRRAINRVHFTDSVLPVVADRTGRVFAMNHCVFDDRALEATLRFVPAPGHTIGNMLIEPPDGSQDTLSCPRDVIHHPSQAQHHGCFCSFFFFFFSRTRQTSTARSALATRGQAARTARGYAEHIAEAHFPARRPAGGDSSGRP